MLGLEVTNFRSKIMEILCSDEEIVNLIKDETLSRVPDRSLIYKNIFPFAYNPDTVKDTDTFICFRVYIPESREFSKTVRDLKIVFYVFSNQNKIRTSQGGLRPDLIIERIDSLFNGKLNIGIGRIEFVSMDDINPSPNFHGAAVEYHVHDFNRPTINGKSGADRLE